MGREIRRVPADWEHPRDERGHYQPLYDNDYHTAAREWIAGLMAWENGTHPDHQDTSAEYYWEWYGPPPDEDYYRQRAWTPEEATHYQVYETVTEGTPVSPVLETPGQIVQWLMDRGHAREAAEAFVRAGRAVSFMMTVSPSNEVTFRSGIDALAQPHRPA